MILAIDIGNTNIVVGCIDSKSNDLIFMERLATDSNAEALEYASILKTAFSMHNISVQCIKGAIISSVVPTVTDTAKRAVEMLTGVHVIVVDHTIKTDLSVKIDEPSTLGSDILVGAVASLNEYPVPTIIVDMGTATTMGVIDRDKNYIGGVIMTGVKVSADALTARASLLSKVSLTVPEKVIGKNTADCIKSGMMYANASAIDGMIERMEEQLGEKCTVVATGGISGKIIPLCKHKDIIMDETLLLKGLIILYNKNIDNIK